MTVHRGTDVMPRALPRGVVTFLFTDIEGSTRLLQHLGDRYADLLREHHRVIRRCLSANAGQEVDTEGDAFFATFESPRAAVAAAVAAQRALATGSWPDGVELRVRMGLHSGEPLLLDDSYVGIDVHRAARIASCAHGGQVVVSARLRDLLADRLPEGVTVIDLGRHRLKDLPEPEHLFQLHLDGLRNDFPPLRSLEPPTNVPLHAAGLVGRQPEQKDLRRLLEEPEVRLVTVTGPGGVGKTRLAGAVSLAVRPDFPYGVWFVDLTAAAVPEDVSNAVASVLQVPVEGEEDTLAALTSHVGTRRMLVVLDNAEQVRDGGVAIARLLSGCPQMRVLVTSRVPLQVEDEHEYALPPMVLPRGRALELVRESDAVQLFVACATRVRRGFALTQDNSEAVAQVCRLVDGLPLAIELAAARTRLFSPQALVARLNERLQLLTGGARDHPERQRTLRATIDWSVALLTEDERRFFVDFSVFRGGARLESVEAVLGPGPDPVELVTALVRHSLLVCRDDPDGEPRFSMLQVLREYAGGSLAEDPGHQRDLRRRHARHVLDLVQAATGPDGRGGREALQRDLENVRAALGFWLDSPGEGDARTDPDAGHLALRLATAMAHYWYQHGQGVEGSGWLERALAAAPEPDPRIQARALRMLGVMYEMRQELDRATGLLMSAKARCESVGDRDGVARCLNSLGVVARSAGRFAEAESLLREAVRLREELGDTEGLNTAMNNLGVVFLDRGAWAEAHRVFTENLARDRAAHDAWAEACGSLNLGVACLLGGRYDEARDLLRTATSCFDEVQDLDGLMESLEACVGLATLTGQLTAAARLAGAAASARRSLGLPGAAADRAHLEAWLSAARTRLGDQAYARACDEGRSMTHDQAAGYALTSVLGAPPVPAQRNTTVL